MSSTQMYVIKRNGEHQEVKLDNITKRIKELCYGLNDQFIDPAAITIKIVSGFHNKISTSDIDILAAETCAYMSQIHPDFSILAARIAISNLHKNTLNSFTDTCDKLKNNKDKQHKPAPLLSDNVWEFINNNRKILDDNINNSNDYNYDYFGYKTLEKSYLLKVNNKIVERPQYMLMRVACEIHINNINKVIESYNMMSKGYFTHATPTLYNAGLPKPQMSSCFLLTMQEDSIEGIYDTLKKCATISKTAGGIGLTASNIRSNGSYIRGSGGHSNGIIPMLRNFNETARYVNQCFVKNTIIYTKDGPKCIEHINTNDYVITLDNTYKKVNKVIYNQIDKEILNIRIKHSYDYLKCTKEHEIACLENIPIGLNYKHIINRLNAGIYNIKFKSAKELQIGDFMVFPKHQNEINNNKFTNDDCRFYGIMLGDGHITKRKNCNFQEAGITLGLEYKRDTIDFIINYLKNNNIHYWENKSDTVINIRWSICKNKHFIDYDYIYNENHEKNIHNEFMNINNEQIKSLLYGLIETDGHRGKEIYYYTTSLTLCITVKYLLYKLGVLSSGHINNNIDKISNYKNIITKKICYVIRIPKHKNCEFLSIIPSNKTTYLEWDNKMFSRITDIQNENYIGNVYDLNIEENHNYLTQYGLVHNSGKRNGAIAIYLEPWHGDIFEFIELRKNHGNEEMRCRDLFLGLWIPDLFMKRVKNNENWTLFSPDDTIDENGKGLIDIWGDEFENRYIQLELENKGVKTIKAQDLWFRILECQTETGTPYMCYKDNVNRKTNQQNLGTIHCSNLCVEVMQYSSDKEVAVCNLASIALPKFVKDFKFDFNELYKITKIVTYNLNNVIDRNYYVLEETKTSNLKHRPIGIGVQGLADTFIKMKYPFESDKASELNKNIFETIYFAACEASCELAEQHRPYDTFKGSPSSKGILQFDMWGVSPSNMWNWNDLKDKIIKYGLRNSLLVAPMPTASTAQILGNNESFEPYTQNIYVRRVMSGEFVQINRYLLNDLIELGMWNTDMKNELIKHNGSVQQLDLPNHIKELYKTVWEIKQKKILDMAIDRAPFIDQSMSLNIHMINPTKQKLSSMHFHGWSSGLKTGMYYLRTKAAVDAIKFTVDNSKPNEEKPQQSTNKYECLGCGS